MSRTMTIVEQEIRSTPAILRQTVARVVDSACIFHNQLRGSVMFLGCGSSYCIAAAAASLFESTHGTPAQACVASEYLPRREWMHVAISRTGQTTELVEAMRRARAAGSSVMLLCGAVQSPAGEHADFVLPLEFAAEQSVIQTRFISAALLVLRLLIGGEDKRDELARVPEQLEAALARFDGAELTGYDQLVFLGRGWRHGLAMSAALNLQETALLPPNGYQTLEYRHGPLAAADDRTLVWSFDPPDDALGNAVLRDARRTGATVRCTGDDPLIGAAQAQTVAVRLAEARGINPDAPRNLTRAIILPDEARW
ncbi:MAG: SIS domain-containing protein [Chloroflexota bacterium]